MFNDWALPIFVCNIPKFPQHLMGLRGLELKAWELNPQDAEEKNLLTFGEDTHKKVFFLVVGPLRVLKCTRERSYINYM